MFERTCYNKSRRQGRCLWRQKYGPVAQLGERSVRIREVVGSNPFRSTRWTLHEHLLFQRRLCRKSVAADNPKQNQRVKVRCALTSGFYTHSRNHIRQDDLGTRSRARNFSFLCYHEFCQLFSDFICDHICGSSLQNSPLLHTYPHVHLRASALLAA